MDLSGSWIYMQEIAKSRLAHNQTDRQVTEYGEGIELLGVAGEIIARRFLGLEEKLHDTFDNGIDFMYAGMRVDVKATVLTPKINFRYLQWPVWKKIRCDLILLTAIDPIGKNGTVIGYATKEELEAAPINEKRTSPCHEIPVMSLHPAWELLMVNTRRFAV